MSDFSWPSISATLTGTPNGSPIPSSSVLVAGENPSGNQEPLQVDASGNLLVSLAASPVTSNVNLTEVGGAAIALGQTTLSVSIPVAIASNQTSIPVAATQSGTWNINNISGTISLPTGASTSALQTQISGQLPATLGAHVTAASLAVNIASDQVVPVSATSLPLPTGASTAANQTNASQKTQIVDGSGNVIASTSNSLNVAVTQPLPTGTNTIGFVDAGPDSSSGPQNITTRDLGTTTNAGTDGQAIITGTPTAGSAATFPVSSRGMARVQVSGSWTGTLQSEVSFDGGTTYYQNSLHITGTPVNTSIFNANVGAIINVVGATNFRMRATAAITGTAVVNVLSANGVGVVAVAAAIKIVDGTNGSSNQLIVKGASTAPVAADMAVVTVISPNNPTYGTKAAGTAATQSELIGAVFNTSLPTLTNGQQAALQVDSSGRLITSPTSSSSVVTIQASEGTLTDGSGSTSGTPNTSTQIFASNASRKYLLIQNLSSTNNIYINFTSAASNGTGSYTLGPLGQLVQESSFVSTEAVNVAATVASVNFTAKQG